MAEEEEFYKLWEFEDGEEVCIKHSRKNKDFLRVDPDDKKDVDWDGKRGASKKVIWKAHVDNENNTVQFESMKTEKFLNLEKDGKGWQCKGGKGGERATFTLERYGKGSAILRSQAKDRCVGSNDSDPRPVQIFARGPRQPFSKPFDKDDVDQKVIIIQRSQDCNQLRVRKDDVILNQESETGENARWKVMIVDGQFRFKSVKKGEFLRIKKDKDVDIGGKKDGALTGFEIEEIFDELGHHVYLKGAASGFYLGVADNGKVKGFEEKGENTRFTLFSENE